MTKIQTDISRQEIHIEGITFTAADARLASDGGPSRLQHLFSEDKSGFKSSLADFLAEWFNETDTVKVHTSGSTGTPKELWVEKRRMMESARLTVNFLDLQPKDTALLCIPLQYIAGKMVVVRSLVADLNLLPVTPCSRPLQYLETAPDFAAMVPLQVYTSIQNPRDKELLRQTRHLIIGGGAIDRTLGEELRDFPHAVWSTYGMTETLSHIALRRLNGPEATDWYTPFNDVQISLSPEGTLTIDAPQVCPLSLVTNDLAEFNDRGQFRILGRRNNTINTGGVKVQTEEIEAQLKSLTELPFAITSVPDPKLGERIVILIQTSGGQQLQPEEFAQLTEAISHLPRYWQPRQVIPVPELPLTGTGKPDRAEAKRIARNWSGEK
ncbi:AMP-binding protein [Phocaeicola coprophilus]|uniref:AMP-binding protein n=1 Tax=Phocaeicola coprophilus TaxID=387090 RepID=UPI002943D090|nr:AMP-binding protein [Phocaeicola coprophilus]